MPEAARCLPDQGGAVPVNHPRAWPLQTTFCERAWTPKESGAAADCFFLLPAHASFSCEGEGTTNIIGAHGAALASANLSPTADALPCPKAGSADQCTYHNTDGDKWVNLALSSGDEEHNSYACTYSGHQVCAYGVTNGTKDASSCSFMLPQGETLECGMSAGSMQISSASAYSFKNRVTHSSPMMMQVQF
eukprot:gene4018-4370_t